MIDGFAGNDCITMESSVWLSMPLGAEGDPFGCPCSRWLAGQPNGMLA